MQPIEFNSDFTINRMVKDLHELIAKLNRVNENTEKIESFYNELNVLNLFTKRHIISVAGLQSVGKTYLIKRTLGLPEDLLLSEVGVGEKRPVLISSNSHIHEMQFHSAKSVRNESGSWEVVTERVSKVELNQGVQNPSSDMLWFEVVLPDEKKLGHLTLALLPGFERSAKSDSQKFLDLFLNCSTGMILVLNHMRLAQMDQEILLQKVSNVYKDKAPGFVLTHASELNDDKRQTIVNNLVKKFNIEDQSQVVYSDKDFENVPAEIERLIMQNSRFTYDSLGLHYNKLVQISQSLFQEICKIESSIKAKYDTEDNSDQLRLISKVFNKYREQYLKEIKKNMDQSMDQHVSHCLGMVNNDLRNEKHNLLQKIKAAFKNDLTFNDKQEIVDWIKHIYATNDPHKLDQMMLKSIDAITKKNASKYKSVRTQQMGQIGQQDTTSSQMQLSFIKTNVINNQIPYSEIDEKDLFNQDINHALIEVKKYLDPNELDITLSDQQLRYMPIIAGGITQQIIATKKIIEQYDVSETEMNDYQLLKEKIGNVESFKGEVENLAVDMKQMIAGTAIFFGIDAIDGEFNSFGAIVGALQSLGLSAGAATGLAGGSIAALTTAFAIKKGAEKIEKYKFERQDYARNVLTAAGNYQVESTLELIGEVMDEMEDRLALAYQARRKNNENLSVYEEIDSRIARLKNECGKLREVAFRNAAFIK
ncbi:hypothetical protein CEF21_21490 [Bacillus sp. FJAT-42376]|uniref:hypothetical protein n=1 Tax=Bacillus sp. FJAT-42376 TaxID=2014076 RepID=UPI000F4DE5D4|nr:hypothetical protein [Bacillus sp. FJAT-42376]AZB44655.1 hypothetical protein CEF21_21490 [Bacillus sp. FJAT-42376]